MPLSQKNKYQKRTDSTTLCFNHVATVQKLINEMMPEDVVCAKDTRDLLIECCVGKWFRKSLSLLLTFP
jgi:hypothetical protein